MRNMRNTRVLKPGASFAYSLWRRSLGGSVSAFSHAGSR